MRREDAGLAFKTKDGTVNVWLLEQHAGVIREVARREIIRAVHHDVVLPDDVHGVLGREPDAVEDDLYAGVDALDGVARGFALVAADVFGAVEDLSLEVGEINGVEIHEAELADARRGEIHRDGGTEPARANAQDAGGFDLLLSGEADFGKN